MTDAGRVSWFGLMAYLVFSFITVLGVQDADFFIPTRQTQLPLINVAIPTEAFFYFAPLLGVSLYVYLHLYVRKSTGALCSAPERVDGTPLEEHLKPWLLNEMVLRWRGDDATASRPLDGLATATVICLVWLAGPFVLGAMWVRSWPAHDQFITTLAGLCLALSIYTGHISWIRMRRDQEHDNAEARASDIPRDLAMTAATILILHLGWTKTESGDVWDRPAEQTVGMTHSLTVFVRTLPNVLDRDWWGALTPARLAEVQFSALPPDQADPVAARQRFRDAWCDRHGMDAKTCGPMPALGGEPFPKSSDLHDAWCVERGLAAGSVCADHFEDLEATFRAEWAGHRAAMIDALAKPDLRSADLRGADLTNAALNGVVLRQARLDGAVLVDAQLERADLRDASLNGAQLARAKIRGANLSRAKLRDTLFWGAQMQQALLSSVEMQGALLLSANLQGADLSFAQMQGADFSGADLAGAKLAGTGFQGAILSGARLTEAELLRSDMQGAVLKRTSMMQHLNFSVLSYTKLSLVPLIVSSPQTTDLRGTIGLGWGQNINSALIGDATTVLPETLLDGSTPFVCTCWRRDVDPPGLDRVIALAVRYGVPEANAEADVRDSESGFFCGFGRAPMKTGTPWPLHLRQPDEPQRKTESNLAYWHRIEMWSRRVNSGPCPTAPWDAGGG